MNMKITVLHSVGAGLCDIELLSLSDFRSRSIGVSVCMKNFELLKKEM